MRVLRVELDDFRSYRQARLEPAPALNLVTGPNAAGKTNLLEALAVLTAGKSPRVKDSENLVRREGEEVARLKGTFLDGKGARHEVVVTLARAGGRKIRLDGKPLRKLSQLVGLFPVVQLFPEDLALATGAPSLRRSYLDGLSARVVPGYVRLRQQLERVLRQRNAALKARRPERELRAQDQPFLERAARIHHLRAGVVGRLREALGALPRAVEGEEVRLAYWAEGRDLGDLLVTLERRLKATAEEERRLKHTRVGPQRDDFRIELGGVAVQENASRGQLRSLLLRLKLAEAALVTTARGEAPLLLLDDALSDMDQARTARTLDHLGSRGQVFLSTPGVPGPVGPGGRIFTVDSGVLKVVT